MNSVLILGNPNSGKSLLFNRLTGLQQKVANFPGVTVEVRSGQGDEFMYRDFPGIYSLDPLTQDEKVAVDHFKSALRQADTHALLYVMDATRMERSLYLLLQILKEPGMADCPLVVALNIIDEVLNKGAKIDVKGLSKELGVTVIPISAKTQLGLKELKESLARLPARTQAPPALVAIAAAPTIADPSRGPVNELRAVARSLTKAYGPKSDLLLVGQNRLDAVFLSTFWGPVVFLAVMAFLFQSIFSGAAPVMNLISTTLAVIGEFVSARIPVPVISDFVKDALFGGIGSFLAFAPQIFILFVVIGVLEDSGYLARATILLHKPLRWFGLTGRSFVPLLSGHACAIPAIMATRTIESPKRRLLTILAIPFMSCSARIPVYAVLIAGFVPAVPLLGRALTLQGLSFFGLYALGITTGLAATALISQFMRRSTRFQDAPFVVELPPYRWPDVRPILKHSISKTLDFIRKAGGIIFVVSVVIWFLGYFPSGAGHLASSYLGWMGHAIEGIFRPMGMDWKIGVAVMTSFLAREVFVGTLGTLYGIANAKENLHTLSDTLRINGMTLATAAALLVFYALSMQCVSTLAVMKKETGSRSLPVFVFVGMTLLAYAAAALTYRLIR